jgi:hypothetical protein
VGNGLSGTMGGRGGIYRREYYERVLYIYNWEIDNSFEVQEKGKKRKRKKLNN